MTTRVFPEFNDPDADRLNTLLDAMRSGVRAPDAAATSEDASDLAAAASQFRKLDDRARTASGAFDATFDAIWEDMMSAQAHANTTQAPFVETPSGRSKESNRRIYPAPPQAKISRLQSFFSAAIVAIMIAGLVSAAWNLRGTGVGDGPGENPRLAATALDGTPEATAEGDFDFLTYIDPLECNARATMTEAERAAFLKQDHDWTLAEYSPVSQPTSDDAYDAALVAREFAACGKYRSGESLITDRFIWERYSLSYMNENYEEATANKLAQERRVSSYLAVIAPSDLFHITDQVASGGQRQNAIAYVPETAVQFLDGRIGVPTTLLIPKGDPTYVTEAPSTLMVGLDVLINTSGEWLLDDQLTVCIGVCEDFINGGQRPSVDLRVNPDESTPIASPTANSEWLAYIRPEECTLEPMTSSEVTKVLANPDGWPIPTYGPVSKPSPADAEEVALAARTTAACEISRVDGDAEYGTPSYLWRYTSLSSPLSDHDAHQEFMEDNGRHISRDLTNITPSDVFLPVANSSDSQDAYPFTYLPEHTIQFPDGRIGVVPTIFIDQKEIPDIPKRLYTMLIVFSNESGTWLLDDGLQVCLGECNDYLNGAPWDGTNSQESPEETPEPTTISDLHPLPGTPIAAPASSSGSEWWSWVSAEECVPDNSPDSNTADADSGNNAGDWAASEFIPFTEPSQQDAEAVASVARQIEGCKQAGLPFTELLTEQYLRGDLMQDPDYVTDYYRLSREISEAFPITDPGVFVRTTTDKPVVTTPSALMRRTGLVRDPLPFVFIPDQAVKLADGRIGIPAAALLSEGEPESEAKLGGLEHGVFRSNLLIFTHESGEWLYDRELTLCIGECDWVWEMHEAPTSPQSTPETTATGLRPLPGTPVASPIATPEG